MNESFCFEFLSIFCTKIDAQRFVLCSALEESFWKLICICAKSAINENRLNSILSNSSYAKEAFYFHSNVSAFIDRVLIIINFVLFSK